MAPLDQAVEGRPHRRVEGVDREARVADQAEPGHAGEHRPVGGVGAVAAEEAEAELDEGLVAELPDLAEGRGPMSRSGSTTGGATAAGSSGSTDIPSWYRWAEPYSVGPSVATRPIIQQLPVGTSIRSTPAGSGPR